MVPARGPRNWGVKMKAIVWLIILLLAVVGVAAIVDYMGWYDIPMIDVVKQVAEDATA